MNSIRRVHNNSLLCFITNIVQYSRCMLIKCDIIIAYLYRYHTSSSRILCTTTRYPWGAELDPWRWSPWLYTTVIINGVRYTGRWGTHFRYNYWGSPQVSIVYVLHIYHSIHYYILYWQNINIVCAKV